MKIHLYVFFVIFVLLSGCSQQNGYRDSLFIEGFPVPSQAVLLENEAQIQYSWRDMGEQPVLPSEYVSELSKWGWKTVDLNSTTGFSIFTKEDRMVYLWNNGSHFTIKEIKRP